MSSLGTARRSCVLSFLCLVAGTALAAAPAPAPAPASDGALRPVASVEGITEYRLDNGLQVLLFPDSSKPTFTVNVTYYVGSRHEGRGEKGMAHLLEHMVFKGTPSHPDIWKALEDHGARFNGTTWVDRTNYYETLPSEVEGNLEWALAMEADRMVNSEVSADDLATEFSVVRNEFEMGENDPIGVLWDRMMSAAFVWHNYGDSTIGNRSDIERVPVANLRAFYERYYQPDNAMLVVAGDFDPEQALALVRKHFGAIPRPARRLDDTYTVEPVQDGARHVELERVGDVAAVGTVYHVPAGPHPDYAAIELVEQILSDEPSGRLYRALVEAGLASSASGFSFGWREPGVAMHLAQVAPGGDPDRVLETMIGVIEGLGAEPITEPELERARRSLLKQFELAMKNSGRVGIELSEWAAAGDWRLMFLHRDRLESVTLEDVRRVAGHYFRPTNRTSGTFRPIGPEAVLRAEIPATPDPAALVRDYRGREAIAEGEEFAATPENIESRVRRTAFPNGMRLALLPKETRGDAVTALVTLRYGTPASLAGRTEAASLLPELLMRGTEKRSYQDIQDRLDELKASVRMGSAGGFRGRPGELQVRITTDREHLVPVLELVHEVLTTPSLPDKEFAILKNERLAGLEEAQTDPQARAFNTMVRTLNPYAADDVRYVPTIEESIARVRALELADVRAIHAQLGAAHAQMSVVGDFDAEAVEAALAASLGAWKSPVPFERVVLDYHPVAARQETIRTPDKKMAIVVAGSNVELSEDDPDFPAMELANYVFGASSKSRLMNRLRQTEGLSYGTGSMLIVDGRDDAGMFGAMAICAPQNAAQARTSMLDEFRRLAAEGIPAAELQDAKDSYALQTLTELANDGTVAALLNEGLYFDRTLAFQRNLYDRIGQLTPDAVKAALGRYVRADALVQVVAGDLPAGASATPAAQ